MLKISYFAWVRERMGRDSESVALPPNVVTIETLIAWLAARDTAGAAAFADAACIRAAIAGAMCGPQTSLEGASEVSLFPPVTGG